MNALSYLKFSDINLTDTFFDSLKADYTEFEQWFKKKASEYAYVLKRDDGLIDGFLYVKIESGSIDDVDPILPPCERIKIGTLKINPHGTRLGERFIKKVFDHAIMKGVPEIYVTVFEKHDVLVSLFMRYGFRKAATKTTSNGTELVLLKKMDDVGINSIDRYPLVKIGGQSIYLLSLYPKWHTRLLPDSILKTEDSSIVQDVSHTNSIHKVYLAAMRGMDSLRQGDVLLIYRTSDDCGPAHFRSVVTSICVVEEYRNINSFVSKDEFIRYCSPYSVFEESELYDFWKRRKYQHVIRFTYNIALPKRVTRGNMIEKMGFNASDYWGFMKLSTSEFHAVIEAGELNESLIIN